jgi:phosphoglycolate phosphatase-like HAD superfamily hydrolase
MLRCIIFDFDGVLVDSNAIKRNAFFHIFAEHDREGRIVAQTLDSHGDGDRFEIIRAILVALSRVADEIAVQRYAEAYNAICEEAVALCPAIPGSVDALAALAPHYQLYISSATLEEPLRRIVMRRGLQKYFTDVFGRPGSKISHLQAIMEREGVAEAQMVFVGDGRRDIQAAQAIGCHFIGIRNAWNDFDTAGLLMLDDLTELVSVVTAIDQKR